LPAKKIAIRLVFAAVPSTSTLSSYTSFSAVCVAPLINSSIHEVNDGYKYKRQQKEVPVGLVIGAFGKE